MEQIKKLGQLCRQNYEKAVLVVVLLLLAAGVWMLYQTSQDERQNIQDMTRVVTTKEGKPIAPVDLAPFEAAMKAATNRPPLTYSGKHNLLNPVKWQYVRGGTPIKVQTGTEVGPAAMRIVSITPLQLTVAFDKVAMSGAEVGGYHIIYTNEVETAPNLRRRSQYVTPGSTNTQVFIVTEVKGPAEAPTELVAVLPKFNGEKISFAPGKHFVKTVGYEAELKYMPSGKTFPRLRLPLQVNRETVVDIDGENYKVVDIAANKVVLSDDSNGKRYTIDQMAPP